MDSDLFDCPAVHKRRSELRASGGRLGWLETDPVYGTDRVWSLDGDRAQAWTPVGWPVGSPVNGYGGGSFVFGGSLLFVVGAEQGQIYRQASPESRPEILTRKPGWCFGGLSYDRLRRCLYAVAESDNCQNGQRIVAIDCVTGRCTPLTLPASSETCFGAPTLSPDGQKLAWVRWQLPDMPWMNSVLQVVELSSEGRVEAEKCYIPTNPSGLQQPLWHGESLTVLADIDQWWRPWQVEPDNHWRPLNKISADQGAAPWRLRLQQRAWCKQGWLGVCYGPDQARLFRCDDGESGLCYLNTPFTEFQDLSVMGGYVYAIGRAPDRLDAIIEVCPSGEKHRVVSGGETTGSVAPDPEPFEVTADDGQSLHGFLYRPAQNGRRPLIIRVHGGPSSRVHPVWDPFVGCWLEHGYAVLDINYRGSAGAGRFFRDCLAGRWGESDTADMSTALDRLEQDPRIDAAAVFIMGRSSGGFTALNALAVDDRFAGAISWFGVTCPWELRSRTHRFESGYLDWLLGAPGCDGVRWRDRSPVHRVGKITGPVLLVQGGMDRVVVPAQASLMREAINQVGGSVETVFLKSEGHGFRGLSANRQVMDRMLAFCERNRK